MKLAIRLYVSGSVKTQAEAAEMAQVSPGAFNVAMNMSEDGRRITSEVDRMVADKTVALSAVIQLASRRAASRMAELVESANEHVAQKAASDLLDRNPETSKTQKIQATSFSVDSNDIQVMAAAMVESARLRQAAPIEPSVDIVHVDTELASPDA